RPSDRAGSSGRPQRVFFPLFPDHRKRARMTSETVLGIDPGAHRAVTPYLNVRGSRCCVFAHQSIPLMSMFETTPIESAIRSGVILRRDLHAAGKAQVFCNSAAA